MAEEPGKLVPQRGITLTLVDGTQVQIVFTLYTLAVLEDEFGSIDAVQEAMAGGTTGKMVRTVGKLLANAVVGERTYSEDEILRGIAIEDIGKAMEAITQGMAQGFQLPQTKQPVPTHNGTAASNYPGAESVTSDASFSDTQKQSFGT